MRHLRWLMSLFKRRSGFEDDLRDEIQAHLDARADALVRECGLTPEAARHQARLEFGSTESYREQSREAGGLRWLDDLRQDVPYALRSLRHNPGFATVAVLTLALGIGANAAIFSAVHAVLLKPLAYSAHSDRLVRLAMNMPAAVSPTGQPLRTFVTLSETEATELRSRTRTLSQLAIAGPDLASLRGYEGAARLAGARISSSAFPMLGARPLLGRVFDARDETPPADPVILLSQAAWDTYFGGDPSVLGLYGDARFGLRTAPTTALHDHRRDAADLFLSEQPNAVLGPVGDGHGPGPRGSWPHARFAVRRSVD